MKHNYLMSFHQDDWNDLQVIRKITDTPVSQLLREGLRTIVKSKKEDISQRRKMRETLSHLDAV
jgi:5-methylcytosine-specific restriction endonuclease McrBC regulatory subunit McrC